MATTNTLPIYDFAEVEEYVMYGVGEEAEQRKANGETRAVYRLSNCDMPSLAPYAKEVCAVHGRIREGYQIRISFSEEDLDPNDPKSAEKAAGLVYDALCELYPNSLFEIVIHDDGEGGKVHAHALVVNQDEMTGKALTNTSHKQVSLATDRVCKRNGYSVVGEHPSRTWEQTKKAGKLSEFEMMLGENIDYCLKRSSSVDEFEQQLDEYGIKIKKKDNGWTYLMEDETVPGKKSRKRRRQASKLCYEFTREGVQQHFDDMRLSRFERLQGRDMSQFVKREKEREAVLSEPEDSGQTVSDEEQPLVVDSFETREDMCAVAEQAVRRDNNNLYEQMRERIRTDGVEQFRKDMQRMQQETERAQEAFHKAQAKSDTKNGTNSAVVGRAAQQMLRTSVKKQDAGATIVALLLLMWAERERQMQRMRQLMQRETLYEKRAVMWTAEKRQHAAETVLKQYEQDVRNGRAYEVRDEHEPVRKVEQVAQPTQDAKSGEREPGVSEQQSVEHTEPVHEQPEPVQEEPRLKVGGGYVGGGYGVDRSL